MRQYLEQATEGVVVLLVGGNNNEERGTKIISKEKTKEKYVAKVDMRCKTGQIQRFRGKKEMKKSNER